MHAQPSMLQIPAASLMFVDIEAGKDRAYIWLISVLVEGKPDSLRLFYAETPASEKDILSDFLSYRKEFDGYTICYYGGLDECLTRRQIATHRLDSGGLGTWFDLQNSIGKSDILSPESSLPSLKYAADHFGYEFRHQDMDGIRAPHMYARNVCTQDAATAKKLLEYGEDDVRALQHMMSAMSNDTDIRLDRSWTPPEHEFPSSFEEQCALVKSLKAEGWSIRSIAKRFCVGRNRIRTRWQAAPEEWRGRKVSFETRSAIETGISPEGVESGCGFQAHREDCIMHGKVIEQVSKNTFRVRVGGTIFQVHKDSFEQR